MPSRSARNARHPCLKTCHEGRARLSSSHLAQACAHLWADLVVVDREHRLEECIRRRGGAAHPLGAPFEPLHKVAGRDAEARELILQEILGERRVLLVQIEPLVPLLRGRSPWMGSRDGSWMDGIYQGSVRDRGSPRPHHRSYGRRRAGSAGGRVTTRRCSPRIQPARRPRRRPCVPRRRPLAPPPRSRPQSHQRRARTEGRMEAR